MSEEYSPPLQVVGYVGTRRGDPERGPEIRMRPDDATLRLVEDGEVVRVVGPRRQELATLRIDETLPRGGVVIRDVAGVAPSEVVRVRKVEPDRPRRQPG